MFDMLSPILHRVALIILDISEMVSELYPGNFLNIHVVHMKVIDYCIDLVKIFRCREN